MKASLILNSDQKELTAEGQNMFEMDRDSTDSELVYRVEALPLDHLMVNGMPVDAKPCQSADDLKCMEFNLTRALNLQKCTQNVDISLSYAFNNSEWYTDIKPSTFNVSLDLRCEFSYSFF